LLTTAADLPRQTASIGSVSAVGHAPRPSPFFATFRYPLLTDNAACPGAGGNAPLLRHPAALMGFKTPFAGLLPPPGGGRVSASAGPACRSAAESFAGRFRQLISCRILFLLLGLGGRSRISGSASGLHSRRWSAPPIRRMRSCLGLRLLQGCGHASGASPWSRHRVDRWPLVPGFPGLSARGFPAPFLRGCAGCSPGLHPLARSGYRSGVADPSAYCEAIASPIHRFRIRLGSAPCLRFRTCRGKGFAAARCTVD
jgi:hypothetical protein